MRSVVPVLALVLVTLLTLGLLAPDASALQRFWVPGSSSWNATNSWALEEGGLPGAGPPNPFDTARIIDDSTTPRTITFGSDGFAKQLFFDLADGNYTLDLSGFELDVSTNLFLDAQAFESNVLRFDGGTLEARTLAATADNLGAAQLIIGPAATVHLFPNADFAGGFVQSAELDANGQDAGVRVEGSLILHQSAIGPELPFILVNDGGQIDVVGGSITNEGSMHIAASVGGLDPSTTGELEIAQAGAVDATTETEVGRDGSGVLSVLEGSTLTTLGETTLGGESTGLGTVTVRGDGGFSNWFVRDALTIGEAGQGVLRVEADGSVEVSQTSADVHLGEAVGGDGVLHVKAQGNFQTPNSVYLGGSSTTAGGTALMLVDAGGSATVGDEIGIWPGAALDAAGGTVTATTITARPSSILRATLDGSIETTVLNLHDGAILELADGELAVVGPGGSLLSGGGDVVFGSTLGTPTLRLENAFAFVDNWQIGQSEGDAGRTVVTGQQANLSATFDLLVGGLSTASEGTLEILDGGRASAGDDVILSQWNGSIATVTVQGVSAGGSRSLLRNTAAGTQEEIEVGRRGVGKLFVLDGALVQSLNNVSIGSLAEGDGTLRVSGSSSGGIPSLLSVSNDLAVGGFASFNAPGGAGVLQVEASGEVLVGGRILLYPGGEIDVDAGGRLSTDEFQFGGGDLRNDGIIDIGGSSLTAFDGDLLVSDTGTFSLDGGNLSVGSIRVEAGGTVDLIDGTLGVVGGVADFGLTSFVYGSSSGVPTIELSQGALAEVTFAWRVGRGLGTVGQTVLRDPGTRLANTGGGAGADLAVGYEGTGFLDVFDGAEVDFNDDVVLGWEANAAGSVLVRGIVGGARSRIYARGGTDNDILVGNLGNGDLTVADGALVEAADDVAVGTVAGSTGLITVFGTAGEGSVPATLLVGDILYVGVSGASPPADLGTGTVLVHPGGEVVVADRTIVGPGDQIVLLGGALRTGRLNLVGDPSRLDWQSGTLDLTASGLIVGPGGVLGSALTLATDMTLRADEPVKVVDGGVLTLTGGRAQCADQLLVYDGSTLQGEGLVQTALGLEMAGTLIPGTSPGTLEVLGDLILSSTATTVVELGGLIAGSEHDQITVSGDLSLGGELDVTLIDGFSLDTGQAFVIADVAGNLTGAFAGLTDDALVGNFGGVDLFVDYGAGDGNDVVLYTTGGNPVSAPDLPVAFDLRIAPNPFNPVTTVSLELPNRAQVKVEVFDIRGARVRQLLDRSLAAGRHELRFDGTDQAGRRLASGVYLARVRVDGHEHLRKLTLVK